MSGLRSSAALLYKYQKGAKMAGCPVFLGVKALMKNILMARIPLCDFWILLFWKAFSTWKNSKTSIFYLLGIWTIMQRLNATLLPKSIFA